MHLAAAPAPYPHLVADIGGTNARFGLISGPGSKISHIEVLACADFAGPLEAIQHYLAHQHSQPPRSAALGIACPVLGDQVRMTNHHWAFSISALQAQLQLVRLEVLNDFTALALSLPHLDDADLRQCGGASAAPDAAMALLGAGTGLGVSGLLPIKLGSHTHYQAISGEGGHVSLAAQNEQQAALIAVLRTRFGHASAERALSGPGLENIYQALHQLHGRALPAQIPTAAAISQAALAASDQMCVATCELFCALLGSVAGDLALSLGARGGVYIGGGIVPKLGDFFHTSGFRQSFEAKGRYADYLAAIPCHVIHAEQPALLGAAVSLQASL